MASSLSAPVHASLEESFDELSRELETKQIEINKVKQELTQHENSYEDSINDEDVQIFVEGLRLALDEKETEAEVIQSRISDLHNALLEDRLSTPLLSSELNNGVQDNKQYIENNNLNVDINNEHLRYDMLHRQDINFASESHHFQAVSSNQNDSRQVGIFQEKLRKATEVLNEEKSKFNSIMIQMERYYVGLIKSKDLVINNCESKLESYEADCEHLGKELIAYQTREAKTEGELSESRSENIALKERITKLESVINEIVTKLNHHATFSPQDDTSINFEESELPQFVGSILDQLQIQNNSAEDKLNAIEQKESLTEKKYENIVKELNSKHITTINDLKSFHMIEIKQLDKNIKEKDSMLLKLNSKSTDILNDLQSHIENSTFDNEHLKSERLNLKTLFNEKELEYQNKYALFMIEKDEILATNRILEKEKIDILCSNESIDAELSTLKSDYTLLEQELNLSKRLHQNLIEERSFVTDKLTKAEKDFKEFFLNNIHNGETMQELQSNTIMIEKLARSFSELKENVLKLQINDHSNFAKFDEFKKEVELTLSQKKDLEDKLKLANETFINVELRLNNEIEKYKDDINTLKLEADTKTTEMKEIQNKLDKTESQINNLERNNNKNDIELSKLNAEIVEKNTVIKNLKEQAGPVINWMEKMQERSENLLNKCNTDGNIKSEFVNENKRISNHNNLLMRKLKKKQLALMELENENQNMESKLKGLTKAHDNALEQQDLLQTNLSNLQSRVVKLKEENQALHTANSGKNNEKDIEIAKLLSNLNTAQTDLQLTRKCLNSKQTSDKKVLKTAMTAQKTVTMQRNEIDQLEQKLSWLQMALENSEKAISALQQTIQKRDSSIKNLKNDNRRLKKRITIIENQAEERDQHIQLIENALEETGQRFNNLVKATSSDSSNGNSGTQMKSNRQMRQLYDNDIVTSPATLRLQSSLNTVKDLITKLRHPKKTYNYGIELDFECADVDEMIEQETEIPTHINKGISISNKTERQIRETKDNRDKDSDHHLKFLGEIGTFLSENKKKDK